MTQFTRGRGKAGDVLRDENRKPIERDCAMCGKSFEIHRPQNVFCSNACRQHAFRNRRNELIKEALEYRKRNAAHEARRSIDAGGAALQRGDD